MNLRTRRFSRLVTAVTVILAAASGVGATAYVLGNQGRTPAASHQVAGYNDGWLDGQMDLADRLGHRVPSAAESQELVTARQRMGTECHLEWDGVQANQYEAICQPRH